MKIMHISDLHIGKRLCDVDLSEDIDHCLKEVISLIQETKIDVLCISGDIYDKTDPSQESMRIFNEFLIAISKLNIITFIIAGNHDSAIRLDYLSDFLDTSGIHIATQSEKIIDIEKEGRTYRFYLVPFFKENKEKQITYNHYFETLSHQLEPTCKNILLAHLFVMGASVCESEEATIGNISGVNATHLKKFDYVALGHLHNPQKMLKETIRYSGTLMKYSFNENPKSIPIVTICDETTIDFKTIKPKRDVRHIKGDYDTLVNSAKTDDYVAVTLTDKDYIYDARVNLLSVYPNLLKFQMNNREIYTEQLVEEIDVLNNDFMALFNGFYQMQNNGDLPSEDIVELVKTMKEKL